MPNHDLARPHFIGIGGIGMSGLAELLRRRGCAVQGSDQVASDNTQRLSQLGVPICFRHRAENLGQASSVVFSSAIKPDNPELLAAKIAGLPVMHRAELLAQVMQGYQTIAVSGSHGKTTTTAMIALVLEAAGLDPTVISGGIINAYGSNIRVGCGRWMVIEADESDGSMINLPSSIAVITNLDPEHLDFYATFERLHHLFVVFARNATRCVVANQDHPQVRILKEAVLASDTAAVLECTDPSQADGKSGPCHIDGAQSVNSFFNQSPTLSVSPSAPPEWISYGFDKAAQVRGLDLVLDQHRSSFALAPGDHRANSYSRFDGVVVQALGRHNAQNALAALAVGRELGVSDQVMSNALAEFTGVQRRLTYTGNWHGVTIVDDYAHHPVEIEAALTAVRATGAARIISVFQPHRYTRLNFLFEQFCCCFDQADVIVLAEVYPAGEQPLTGVDHNALATGLLQQGHRHIMTLPHPKALPRMIASIARAGDTVLCLGAGSITHWARALPEQLKLLAPG